MNNLARILMVVLVAAPCAYSAEDSASSLRWEIIDSGYPNQKPYEYREGEPIPLRLTVTNTGKQTEEVYLKDHDAFHGTLRYPLGIMARVVDASGKLMTTYNPGGASLGWWSQFIMWSTTFQPEMPGDVIPVPPGQSIVRTIHLDEVLKGCPCLPNGLAQGSYSVQLRSGKYYSDGEHYTNVLRIKIGPPRLSGRGHR